MHLTRSSVRARLRAGAQAAVLACAVPLAVVVSGAQASGSTYYAAPGSTAAGSCTQSSPCGLNQAIAMATSSGDVVVVLPGTYSITSPVVVSQPVTVEGEPGQPRPSLQGAPSLQNDTVVVSGGATIRHLDIETANDTGSQTAALSLAGATAEDLTVFAGAADTQGEALDIGDTAQGTIVRTVLARSQAPDGEAVSIKDRGTPGSASVYNLTAIGESATTAAISGNMSSGTATIVDSIASGQVTDVSTKLGTDPIAFSYSDFRPAASSGYADGGHNLSVPPVFVNPTGALPDYHEAAGSPTIAAGSATSGQAATDLDGDAWGAGIGPDMGAYEYVATQTGAGSGTGADGTGTSSSSSPSGFKIVAPTHPLPRPTRPVLGVSVTVAPVSGVVGVELPRTHRFLALGAAAQIPVGAVIDATRGKIELTSAVNRSGATKTGTFTGGAFVISQSRRGAPLTRLRLAGGSFARACTIRVHGAARFHNPRHYRSRRVVRQLWGSDSGGRFVTSGNDASATVRGTVWLVQDRCDGTFVHVVKGHVLVRDRARHRPVLLGPGQSYLARARG